MGLRDDLSDTERKEDHISRRLEHPSKSVGVSLPTVLIEQLDAEAKSVGISRSELIRQHLKRTMESEAGEGGVCAAGVGPQRRELDNLALFRAAWSRITGT
jgi:Arc/MetJ-type ribon-helix-helix transcriptional regulator